MDEGKGKVVDILSEEHGIVVRYNGGANAGHTVVVGNETFKLHQVPSGVVAPNSPLLIMTHGMVIHPVSLRDEILELQRAGIDVTDRLLISDKAHCVMPWHIAQDIKSGGSIGTTKKGIGPTYADKAHRWDAIRMGDLKDKLQKDRHHFFIMDEAFHGTALWDDYCDAANFLQSMICPVDEILRQKVKCGTANILFEGANGIFLDIDFGTYPYCTSSGVGPAAIPQSCGLPNLHLDRIIGVIKCYATRVGEGPFPSEIITPEDEQLLSTCMSESSWLKYTNRPYPDIAAKEISHLIREKGNEYGTTTGRPRRIGWFDLDMTRRAVELTGSTEIALMHVDTLSGMDEVGLYKDGNVKIQPGWGELHGDNFNSFVDNIHRELKAPINMVSYGPARDEVFYRGR